MYVRKHLVFEVQPPTFTTLQSFYSYTYRDTQNWYSAQT